MELWAIDDRIHNDLLQIIPLAANVAVGIGIDRRLRVVEIDLNKRILRQGREGRRNGPPRPAPQRQHQQDTNGS
jgi:hypothetical protein